MSRAEQEVLLIVDFGSQFTQLIARRLRELNVYCEIHPYNKIPTNLDEFKAVVLSGSPQSVRGDDAHHPDLSEIRSKKPCLNHVLCAKKSTSLSLYFYLNILQKTIF